MAACFCSQNEARRIQAGMMNQMARGGGINQASAISARTARQTEFSKRQSEIEQNLLNQVSVLMLRSKATFCPPHQMIYALSGNVDKSELDRARFKMSLAALNHLNQASQQDIDLELRELARSYSDQYAEPLLQKALENDIIDQEEFDVIEPTAKQQMMMSLLGDPNAVKWHRMEQQTELQTMIHRLASVEDGEAGRAAQNISADLQSKLDQSRYDTEDDLELSREAMFNEKQHLACDWSLEKIISEQGKSIRSYDDQFLEDIRNKFTIPINREIPIVAMNNEFNKMAGLALAPIGALSAGLFFSDKKLILAQETEQGEQAFSVVNAIGHELVHTSEEAEAEDYLAKPTPFSYASKEGPTEGYMNLLREQGLFPQYLHPPRVEDSEFAIMPYGSFVRAFDKLAGSQRQTFYEDITKLPNSKRLAFVTEYIAKKGNQFDEAHVASTMELAIDCYNYALTAYAKSEDDDFIEFRNNGDRVIASLL